MTREEAIDVLRHNYPSPCFTFLCEAVEIAIEALSAEPEQTCEYWDSESKFCALCRPSAEPRVSDCWGCKCPKMERLKEQKTFSEMVRLHDAKRTTELT